MLLDPSLTSHSCRRDQALAAIQESMMRQQEQQLAIETEIQGYRKDIVKEQVCRRVCVHVWCGTDTRCGASGKQVQQ